MFGWSRRLTASALRVGERLTPGTEKIVTWGDVPYTVRGLVTKVDFVQVGEE